MTTATSFSDKDKTFFIIVLAIIIMLGPLSIDLYLPAFPSIAKSLNVSLNQIQMTLSIYIFGFALGQLVYGPLSDRFGRKKILFLGLVLHILSSLYAANAINIYHLLIARSIQSIGASAMAVTTATMVIDVFKGKESSRVLSSIFMIMMIAPLFAPILGGKILTIWHWQAMFYFLSIVGCIAFLFALWKIPETLPINSRLQKISIQSLYNNYSGVLKHKYAMGYMLSNSFIFAGMFAFITGSPIVYIEVYGVNPEHYGYLFGLNILSLAFMNRLNIWLLKRFEMISILKSGCIFASMLSCILIIVALLDKPHISLIVIPIMLFVGCLSLTGPNANVLAMSYFPKSQSGTANALSGTIRFITGGIASIIVGNLDNESASPMMLVIAFCGILSLLTFSLFGLKSKTD